MAHCCSFLKGENHEPRIAINDCPFGIARHRRLPEQRQDSGNARRDAGRAGTGANTQGGFGGLLGQLGLGGASAGGVLSGGLGELLERFKQSGQSETAEFLGQYRHQ